MRYFNAKLWAKIKLAVLYLGSYLRLKSVFITHESKKQSPKTFGFGSFIGRFLIKTLFFGLGLVVCGLIFGTLVVSSVWPNLPNLTAMTDYRPRIPLRIYSADKILLAEYGEERRNVLRIDEFPEVMKLAILAAEDDNFYEHSGVDWRGVPVLL